MVHQANISVRIFILQANIKYNIVQSTKYNIGDSNFIISKQILLKITLYGPLSKYKILSPSKYKHSNFYTQANMEWRRFM